MKIAILSMIIFITFNGCNKETQLITPPLPAPPPAVQKNTPPQVYSGGDWTITVADDSVTLSGYAYDPENNITSYSWSKISGPTSFQIDKPDSMLTKVRKLVKGSYQFVLTVTDGGGLSSSAKANVQVVDNPTPGHGEVIIGDLQWQCPMGCAIEIKCLSCKIPDRMAFKVYIMNKNASAWVEVVPDSQWTEGKYSYSVYNNNLFIFSPKDEVSTAQVKLVW